MFISAPCGPASAGIEQPGLFKLAQVVHFVECLVGGTVDAALDGWPRRSKHLVEHTAPAPGFRRVEDEFITVLCANEACHGAYLSPFAAGGRIGWNGAGVARNGYASETDANGFLNEVDEPYPRHWLHS